MSTALPGNVSYGYITGRIILAVADSQGDLDNLPEALVPTGTFTFTPRPSYVLDAGATTVIVPQAVVSNLDAAGYLTSPGDGTLRAVTLVAGDNTSLNPTGWTYSVSAKLNGVALPLFDIQVIGGATLDLASLLPAVASVGISEAQSVSLAAQAAASALAAQGYAAASAASAATVTTAASSAAASAASAATSASLVSAPADTAMAVILGNAASASRISLDARYSRAVPLTAALATQGLYRRTIPTPDSNAPILPLCADPHNAGYLWAIGQSSNKLGYTTDHGQTFTPVVTQPNGGVVGMSACQILITSGIAGGDFMFLLMSSSAANQGQLWRSPAPNATGSNLAFTQIFGYDTTTHLINGPGGASASSVGYGENFRNSSFALAPDGSKAYLLPYAAGVATGSVSVRTDGAMTAGSTFLTLPTSQAFQGWQHGNALTVAGAGAAGATLSATIQRIWSVNTVQLSIPAQTTVTGASVTFHAPSNNQDLQAGPQLRVSSNSCAADPATVVWAPGKQWPWARHGHAVKVINGLPWVSLGDYGFPADAYGEPPVTQVGVWVGVDTAGTNFAQLTLARVPTPWNCINMFPISIGGQPMVIGESDSKMSTGPVLIITQSYTGTSVNPVLLHQTNPPIVATMRCLSITPEGNIMYYATGEGGSVGPVDAIIMSAPPFTVPIVLEQMAPNAIGNALDAITDGAYVWFGTSRITREKIIGQ